MSTLFDPANTDRRGRRPVGFALALRRVLGVANLAAALAVVVALAVNIADRVIQGIFDPTHYFQYFTIQTCIINVVALLIGGMFALMRTVDPRWYSVFRAAVATYAVVVGVVYNVLLAGIPSKDGYIESFAFPNLIEHMWVPIFIGVEWLLMPGRSRLSWRVMWITVAYPLVWVALSMIRGLAGDGWYPYFFLNVGDTGLNVVIIYILALAAFIVGLNAAVIGIGRVHGRVFADLGLDRDRL